MKWAGEDSWHRVVTGVTEKQREVKIEECRWSVCLAEQGG